MKKIILLFSIIMFALVSMGQTIATPTEATVNATITGEYNKVITFTAATDATTKNYIFRIRGVDSPSFKIGLYCQRTSGTASGTLAAYGSLDGNNWVALADSITFTSLTASVMDTETIDMANYLWPYLRLKLTQTGTAVFVHKPYVYVKYD